MNSATCARRPCAAPASADILYTIGRTTLNHRRPPLVWAFGSWLFACHHPLTSICLLSPPRCAAGGRQQCVDRWVRAPTLYANACNFQYSRGKNLLSLCRQTRRRHSQRLALYAQHRIPALRRFLSSPQPLPLAQNTTSTSRRPGAFWAPSNTARAQAYASAKHSAADAGMFHYLQPFAPRAL